MNERRKESKVINCQSNVQNRYDECNGKGGEEEREKENERMREKERKSARIQTFNDGQGHEIQRVLRASCRVQNGLGCARILLFKNNIIIDIVAEPKSQRLTHVYVSYLYCLYQSPSRAKDELREAMKNSRMSPYFPQPPRC